MRNWIVRFAVLLAFNIVVLLVIGWLSPADVGWSAIWAGIVLTLLTIWVRPLVTKWFTGHAAKSAAQRTKAGESIVQVGVVLLVALIVWVITVVLSGVTAGLNPLAYVIPPIILAIGWWLHSLVAVRAEQHAGALYDKATGATATTDAAASPASPSTSSTSQPHDGLTPEQRRMLDELGT